MSKAELGGAPANRAQGRRGSWKKMMYKCGARFFFSFIYSFPEKKEKKI